MKKILIIIVLMFSLISCKIPNKNALAPLTINTMGTIITVKLYDEGTKEHYNKIKEIYEYYDYLGSNIIRETERYNHLNNVYKINLNKGNALEVNDDLFNMISLSLLIMEETNGYFNPLIGEAVDIWKNVIEEYNRMTISEEIYNEVVLSLNEIPRVTSDDIILDNENKTVKVLGRAKLDLGAVAKGYATEEAVKYIKSKNIKTYNINAGMSSLAYGIHPDKRPFNTGLNDPYNLFDGNGIYGILKVQNKHVVTSGDYIQYVKYEDKILHHILNPFDYMPKNYYHTITILGDDGGLLDAYSTAIFNMPEEEAINFLESKGLKYSFYKANGVSHNFSEEEFELMKLRP
ncbi:MAG: FAD:protein FMN transferase [Acholeplasmataceae bacterium]|nr:FAD:protein FMN transferase [Acholeplasmataceae bacterium]